VTLRAISLRVLRAGLLVGLLLNALGWLGNVFLLGPLWRSAFTEIAATPWRESPWRDVISLAPDFVYSIANSGLLPWGLSAATTLLALVTFIPGAWLVHALLRGHALA